MEVRLRLQKAGKSASKRYNYRIVAISKSDTRDGRHLDLLGYYDPAKKPAVVSINKTKLNKWLKQGAQMSDTVKSLVKNLKDT
ncbi:MAG: 30S ribosomal protein S16 [Candidatus Omnitrophica bacterium]|nr:30S ribosomal protein S16 [Candidatus Omnitrophota bacterium]MCK5179685.1 30S ribosomal protein S16 [Candidatus Omnitrophota bacterium]